MSRGKSKCDCGVAAGSYTIHDDWCSVNDDKHVEQWRASVDNMARPGDVANLILDRDALILFVKAYDAWRVLHDAKDRDDMSYEELCAVQQAEQAMHNARLKYVREV